MPPKIELCIESPDLIECIQLGVYSMMNQGVFVSLVCLCHKQYTEYAFRYGYTLNDDFNPMSILCPYNQFKQPSSSKSSEYTSRVVSICMMTIYDVIINMNTLALQCIPKCTERT